MNLQACWLVAWLEQDRDEDERVTSAGCGFTGLDSAVKYDGTALKEYTSSGLKVFSGLGFPVDCRELKRGVSAADDSGNGVNGGWSPLELLTFI